MYGRHILITFLKIFMNWDTETNAFTHTHLELHTSVQQENRAQPLLEHYKETKLGKFPGSQPKGHCVTMSLPSKSWDVPWNQAKKQFSSMVRRQPHTEGAGLEEMLPIISFLRQKLKS